MQVVFHLGAPCTDDDMLIKSLMRNRPRLAERGTVVPPPGRYRSVIRDTMRAMKGAPSTPEVQDAMLDAIADEDRIDRLILSDPRFVCINRLVVQGAQIWPMIDRVSDALCNLWPGSEVEFFIGMRDPGTLIPELFRTSRFTDFAEFTENMQPHAVAWSEMLQRLRLARPDCPVTVWCNEDTPLLWAEILRELAGDIPWDALQGRDDLLERIMEPAGFKRMLAYMEQHPPETEVQRRRIVTAFLDKFALEDAIEEEIAAPGWTEEMLAEMSEAYDEDMTRVARIPGVTFLSP